MKGVDFRPFFLCRWRGIIVKTAWEVESVAMKSNEFGLEEFAGSHGKSQTRS